MTIIWILASGLLILRPADAGADVLKIDPVHRDYDKAAAVLAVRKGDPSGDPNDVRVWNRMTLRMFKANIRFLQMKRHLKAEDYSEAERAMIKTTRFGTDLQTNMEKGMTLADLHRLTNTYLSDFEYHVLILERKEARRVINRALAEIHDEASRTAKEKLQAAYRRMDRGEYNEAVGLLKELNPGWHARYTKYAERRVACFGLVDRFPLMGRDTDAFEKRIVSVLENSATALRTESERALRAYEAELRAARSML
jgi:hypothetical protein